MSTLTWGTFTPIRPWALDTATSVTTGPRQTMKNHLFTPWPSKSARTLAKETARL